MTETSKPTWYHSVWFVLLMIFVVLMPFGLPLLWKSPRFTRWAKILLTVLVLLETYWLTLVTIAICEAVLQHLDQLQQTFL